MSLIYRNSTGSTSAITSTTITVKSTRLTVDELDGNFAHLNYQKENRLGNPTINGQVLSSTSGGTRSWITIPSLTPGTTINNTLRWNGSNWVESDKILNENPTNASLYLRSGNTGIQTSWLNTLSSLNHQLKITETGTTSANTSGLVYEIQGSSGDQSFYFGEDKSGWIHDSFGMTGTTDLDNLYFGDGFPTRLEYAFNGLNGNVSFGAFDNNSILSPNPTNTGILSFIGGGLNNTASGDFSFVAGGQNNVANGNNSFAQGNGTTANGGSSHAEGDGTTANGGSSHAEGSITISDGFASHAEGFNTQAIGDYSHSQGSNTIANGISSHAAGFFTQSESYAQYTIGRYNNVTGAYTAGAWIDTEPLFVIGNGASSLSLNDAFVVYKNGNVLMDGGILPKAITITTNTNAQSTDFIIICESSLSTITYTLPASPENRQYYKIKRRGGNNVIIDANGNAIDGALTYTLKNNYDEIEIYYDGAEWVIMANYTQYETDTIVFVLENPIDKTYRMGTRTYPFVITSITNSTSSGSLEFRLERNGLLIDVVRTATTTTSYISGLNLSFSSGDTLRVVISGSVAPQDYELNLGIVKTYI